MLACRAGDGRAWERLVDRYERLVFSIPLNYGLAREDATDIAQIVFTILLESLDGSAAPQSLGPWLATVARRHTWRQLDRNRRERTSESEDLAGSEVLTGGENPVEQWELTEWLHHGLSRLGEPCRELLQALYLDPQQPSYAEVAKRLKRPVGSIGPTRARCLKEFRKVLLER